MQRPGWSTIVAILMILIGGCGSIQDLKQIKVEELMEFQDDLLEELSKEFDIEESISENEIEQLKNLSGDTLSNTSDTLSKSEIVKSTIKNLSHMSEAAIAKLKIEGYIGLPISILFIVIGILFFYMKKHMLHICMAILIIGIGFSVYQLITLGDLDASKILRMGIQMNLTTGIAMSFVIMIILFVSDKSYYLEEKEFGDYLDE